MGLISDEDISKIIEANDIVSVAAECIPDLKQKGGRFMACCPFHKEKTPSFQIDQNKQLWHCFGCGEGGNIVTLVEKIYDMNFPEAMEFLANKANIQIKKDSSQQYSKSEKSKLLNACKLAADFYHMQLTKVKNVSSDKARKYLSSRDINSDVAKKWKLGFAPGNNQLINYLLSKKVRLEDMISANLAVKGSDGRAHDRFFNRIMFPISDVQGNIIAFGGRIMDDSQPKYLNTGETPLFHKSKIMFGFDKAKSNMTSSGSAIVVEGYTDVIAMHEAGINYAVATLGTALTKQHIRLLNQHAKKKIIYLFDGDEAGQRAADRALNFIDELSRPEIHGTKAQLMALTLPDNLDPKEYIDKYGKDKLVELLSKAQPLLDYGINRKISAYDLSVAGNKSKAATAAVQVLAPIKDSLLAKEYCQIIAQRTDMRSSDLIEILSKLKKPVDYDDNLDSHNLENTTALPQEKSSKTLSLEKELLCVFAKYPEVLLNTQKSDFQYDWKSESHKKIFTYMAQEVQSNPKIKAKEIIMKVHQKNPKTANMLTEISKMYDIKNNPLQHAKYLVALLYVEQLSARIFDLRQKFANISNDEEKSALYEQLTALQKQQNELKLQANRMI